MTYKFYC